MRRTTTAAAVVGTAVLALGGGLWIAKIKSTRNVIIRSARNVVPFPRTSFINGTLVSQGRAFGTGYSSCGDLWNYVLDAVNAPKNWVNRNDAKRGIKWSPGANISRPVAAAKIAGAWVPYTEGHMPKAGDLMLIGEYPNELEHVFVVLDVKGNTMTTADYGGVENAGHLSEKRITNGLVVSLPAPMNSVLGGRKAIGWIDADKIPRAA